MSEQQWDRIYRKVFRIKQPTHRWETFAWSMLSVAVTAAVGFMAWWQTRQGMTEAAQSATDWQGWVYGALVIVAVLFLLLAAAAHRGRVNQFARDKEDVLEEMRDFHMPTSLEQPPDVS